MQREKQLWPQEQEEKEDDDEEEGEKERKDEKSSGSSISLVLVSSEHFSEIHVWNNYIKKNMMIFWWTKCFETPLWRCPLSKKIDWLKVEENCRPLHRMNRITFKVLGDWCGSSDWTSLAWWRCDCLHFWGVRAIRGNLLHKKYIKYCL